MILGYWERRSKCYDRQHWTMDRGYLGEFVKCGSFRKSDIVLDVGTGTGAVAEAVAPLVKEVVAVDISKSMLNIARGKGNSLNIDYKYADARRLPFPSGVFDKVTGRMVFHHIMEGGDRAILECCRVLKSGGIIVFSEGVPPDERVKPRYDEIFRIKERRKTYLPKDIVSTLKFGGFQKIRCKTYWMRNVSVRNWLEDSCLKSESLEEIIRLHMEGSSYFREVYNMRVASDDVFMDWKFIIATGMKTY
jgi:ubiquinone/menaquinone biosynthesis C-methylase UbiE